MITIGYSTKKIKPEFREYIEKSCGLPHVEVIPFENPGTHSLTEAYNIILEKSSNDIVVLCHDDIYFEKKNWGNKVLKHFKRNPEYGIIGVAGSVKIPESGMWWEDTSRMRGIVNHEHEGKKWESKYSSSLGNKIEPVVLVDGLFLVVNKINIKKTFNEEVKGFHMYDVDFCVRNYIENVNIGVIYDIRVTHLSIGMTNDQWEKNRQQFAETYKEHLPLKKSPNIDLNTPIKVLMTGLFFKTFTGSEMYMYELSKALTKLKCDVTVVSDINGPLSKIANRYGIKTQSLNEFPGYKLGDGKWMLNTSNGPQPSQPNMFYKVSEPKFDIIHTQHKPITERVIKLYPNIPKLSTIHSEVISLEDPIQDSSIVRYVAIRPEIKQKMNVIDGIHEDLIDVVYNPIDENRFNTTNTKNHNYILFVGTIDYLRKNSIYDICNYAKEQNKELWLVGENKSDYLDDLLKNTHVKYHPSTNQVEKFVKNCSETAGILLGRTTIEGWMCGKEGWIYDVDDKGQIKNKSLISPPDDIIKFYSMEVAKKIKEIYIKILKKW